MFCYNYVFFELKIVFRFILLYGILWYPEFVVGVWRLVHRLSCCCSSLIFSLLQLPLPKFELNTHTNTRYHGLCTACYWPCWQWQGKLLLSLSLILYVGSLCEYVGLTVFFFFFFESQSTYCSSLYRHCETMQRSIHIVNLDPAAENFDYPVAMGELGLLLVF